jgi:hypothetical protein
MRVHVVPNICGNGILIARAARPEHEQEQTGNEKKNVGAKMQLGVLI